jgi:hypothetical protein
MVYYIKLGLLPLMEHVQKYLHQVFGVGTPIKELTPTQLTGLPYYMQNGLKFYTAGLLGQKLLLVQFKDPGVINPTQVQKQLEIISHHTPAHPVLLLMDIPATLRNRLVHKGIDFIVPNKQIFLPSLLVDLKETYKRPPEHAEKVLPSAQVILLYRLLNKTKKIEELPLKDLAKELGYSAMAVTKAAENLLHHELCVIKGTKEKYLHFELSSIELWNKAKPVLVNPILKKVYVDAYPRDKHLTFLLTGISALSDYTDINPGREECRAIEKGLYYSLQKRNLFQNLNEYEGPACLEVWKYDPVVLARDITDHGCVDPLSLYLSLRDNTDERVQMACEQLIEKVIW